MRNEKRLSQTNRRLSTRLFWQLILALCAYTVSGVFFYFLARNLYNLFIWQGNELIYQLVHWLDMRADIVVLLYLMIGYVAIFLHYWRQPFRYIGEIAQATAAVFGGNVDYEMIWGAPPVINDDKMAALAAKAAKTVAGEDHVITEVKAPNMGGEDFAYYLEKLPGAFMFLSSSNPAKGTDVSHHNPKFDVDEDVLWEGSAVFVAIVEEFLNK